MTSLFTLKPLADNESNSPMGFLATIGTAKLLFVSMAFYLLDANDALHNSRLLWLGQSIAAVLLTGGTPRTYPQCDHDGIWNRKISDKQDSECSHRS